MTATDFRPHVDLCQAGKAFAASVTTPAQSSSNGVWRSGSSSLFMSCSNSRAVMCPLRSLFRGVGQSSSESDSGRPIGPIGSAAALPRRHYRAQALAIGQRANGRSAGPRPSDTLPAAAFDLVHARLVLIVLRRPPSKSNPGRTQPRHRIRAAVNYDSSRTRRPHKLWSEDSCSCRGRIASKPKLRPGC